jgi:hypothetical protein
MYGVDDLLHTLPIPILFGGEITKDTADTINQMFIVIRDATVLPSINLTMLKTIRGAYERTIE